MKKTNKSLALVVLALAVPSAVLAGYNEYTKTKSGNIADVTLTVNDTVISDKLSEEGVDTLRFTRSSGLYSVKLRSAGVVVEGTGRIQCGPPSGVILLIR